MRCGKCCRIKDGYVYVSMADIERLADFVGEDIDDFMLKYTERLGKFLVLKSFPNGDCIFYDDEVGCKVYDARPQQCRTFPFWRSNLASKEAWEMTAKECEGIGRGRLYSKHEIEAILKGQKST